ncbi:hypothetical protein HCN51_51310 [Nonomuraea sp. FMUSA5-5]|uniref:LPXTG cell wall anchor domain-containing protein n=1 Tax=Nonomuraea composti TaxID=2720023 RepID=A0ABX1BJ37_9ACTN|nr:DUF6152 family protein [Nonomuraea sp. FMUSA5-5]NJP97725.1 hypothetical protein [Nonomuraea sp. FMUSA5-5]
MKSMIFGLALLSTLHHGWEDFRTERPLYVSGTVSEVRWGNPHPQVRLRVAAPVRVPSGLAERSIPAELEELGGREVLQHTRAFNGRDEEVVLILAPLERLTAWGMPDRIREGERLEAVGYAHREHADEFRPELLIRQDGRAIRQRSVRLPQTPPSTSPSSASESEGSHAASAASDGGAGAGPLPWIAGAALLAGGGMVVAVRMRRRRHGASDVA